jgi:hypothetical protein
LAEIHPNRQMQTNRIEAGHAAAAAAAAALLGDFVAAVVGTSLWAQTMMTSVASMPLEVLAAAVVEEIGVAVSPLVAAADSSHAGMGSAAGGEALMLWAAGRVYAAPLALAPEEPIVVALVPLWVALTACLQTRLGEFSLLLLWTPLQEVAHPNHPTRYRRS